MAFGYESETPSDRASLGRALRSRASRFVDDAQRCLHIGYLCQLTQDAVSVVGMTAVASGIVSGPRRADGDLFHFVNWPEDWLEQYLSQGYVEKDPVPRWAIVSGAPISWSQLFRGLAAGDPGHEVYVNAAKRGFTEGFVTPARGIDGSLGLVSVGGERGERGELLPRECLYLQSISLNAFHRAEEISRSTSVSASAPPITLASRESDLGRRKQSVQEAKLKNAFHPDVSRDACSSSLIRRRKPSGHFSNKSHQHKHLTCSACECLCENAHAPTGRVGCSLS